MSQPDRAAKLWLESQSVGYNVTEVTSLRLTLVTSHTIFNLPKRMCFPDHANTSRPSILFQISTHSTSPIDGDSTNYENVSSDTYRIINEAKSAKKNLHNIKKVQ